MKKSLVLLALSGMIAACAAQPAAPVAAQKPAAEAQRSKIVCEEIEEESTGSRLGTKRECKTVPVKEGQPTS